jgi:flagellar hook-basal body complex protein FliE
LADDKADQYQASGDQKSDHRGTQGQSFQPILRSPYADVNENAGLAAEYVEKLIKGTA